NPASSAAFALNETAANSHTSFNSCFFIVGN
ncbi:MAG: hypothetical protein ACI8QF_003487, partial [Limisphaerales bacterium]